MKLEEQVVSLELSKQLKEAGYPQQGLWWWYVEGEHYCLKDKVVEGKPFIDKRYEPSFPEKRIAIAPTVAELSRQLPINTRFIKRGRGWNSIDNIHYEVEDWNGNLETDCCLVNALAKMWLYIKEKKC